MQFPEPKRAELLQPAAEFIILPLDNFLVPLLSVETKIERWLVKIVTQKQLLVDKTHYYLYSLRKISKASEIKFS